MAHKKLNTGKASRARVFVVILVGGKGKRLRPLSTSARPKAFISVTMDRKTMFRRTVDRARKIAPECDIVIVANRAHAGLVRRDFPGIRKENLILEPVSRNTGPALALTAAILEARAPGSLMVMLPTDQYIIDEAEYFSSISSGLAYMKSYPGHHLVLGLSPASASTGFGYLKTAAPIRAFDGRGRRIRSIYSVERFVEKPDQARARRYIRDGRYLWNTGAFIFNTAGLLKAVSITAPDISALLGDTTKALKNYSKFPDISIDYAVMEKTGGIAAVKGRYRWRDMGSFESIMEILTMELRPFITKDGKVMKIL